MKTLLIILLVLGLPVGIAVWYFFIHKAAPAVTTPTRTVAANAPAAAAAAPVATSSAASDLALAAGGINLATSLFSTISDSFGSSDGS